MMIPEKIATALNQQVAHEFEAMVQYLAIANFFQRQTLPELAKKFYEQAAEERSHAMKFIQYIHETGAALNIPEIKKQIFNFESVEQSVELALSQEISVSNQINAIVKLSRDNSDYATENFLQFFIKEQVEEVSSMQDLLAVVQRAGDDRLLLVEEFIVRQTKNENFTLDQ